MSTVIRYLQRAAASAAAPPERPRIVSLDFETYSHLDIRQVGVSPYVRHPSTEVLMLAWRELGDNSEPRQWHRFSGEPLPDDLFDVLHDPEVTLSAWNATFEREVFRHVLKIDTPIERWLDPMALARSLSLPGSLDKCGKVMGLPLADAKDSSGRRLIRLFSSPQKPSKARPWKRTLPEHAPEDWEAFLRYNRQDVVAEQKIYLALSRYQMPDQEWRMWALDYRINDAGIPINLNLVDRAIELAEAVVGRPPLEGEHPGSGILGELARWTGLQNPNSPVQLLVWLQERGYPFENLQKANIETFVAEQDRLPAEERTVPPVVLEVLRARLTTSKASIKKFKALKALTDVDGLLRHAHNFLGAGRTGRWSGRGFQPQNLVKPSKSMESAVLARGPETDETGVPLTGGARLSAAYKRLTDTIETGDRAKIEALYGDLMEALVAAVRPCVKAPPGYVLLDADLSAIENVVLGWLARDEKILRVFRENRDPYIDFATDLFQKPYEEIEAEVKAGNKAKRSLAKPGVLGCGFMLGAGSVRVDPKTGREVATGLLGYAWSIGVPEFTPEMSSLSVETFRSKFNRVVQFWHDLDTAFRRCITTHETVRVGYITVEWAKPFVRLVLPSGRALHYLRPKIERRQLPWGDMGMQITYENQQGSSWTRVTTHPGKLAENVTQAVARDILANGLRLAHQMGLDLRMHVHDQAVALSRRETARRNLDRLIGCLTTLPNWGDDKLPLRAAGHISEVFVKD